MGGRDMKKKWYSALAFAAVLFLVGAWNFPAAAADGAMICGKKIIHAGDSMHLLISRFGQPENREFVGMVRSGDACVKAEEWLYICREHAQAKMYVIRIVGTTIVSIKWLPDVGQ